jgi:hypothetical protein
MGSSHVRLCRLALAVAIVGMTSLLWFPRIGPARAREGSTPIPLVRDWSHRHMVFSPPRSLVETFRWQQEPRYFQQVLRRNAQQSAEGGADSRGWWFQRRHLNELGQDWSQSLGAGATIGAGQYPAKFSFSVTAANCASDFVAFHTGLAGSVSQASIIAYSNLYTGCGGTVPTTYWAYNTGGTISTSVSLSADGSQLAFVQAQAGVATLVLLKWTSSTTATAGAPTGITNASTTGPGTVSNANYRTCVAPCMTTIAFNGGSTDTQSAPYYDFSKGSDTLYVGDDSGKLHKFTGVFSGTPAEAGSPWPVTTATVKLSSPVYDSGTGNVFVTTTYQQVNNSGARLAAVCAMSGCSGVSNGNATTAIGTVTPSNVLGPTQTSSAACNGPGTSGNTNDLRLDAPMVDSTAGKVYAFVGNDGTGNSAVYEFSTTVDSSHFSFHSCGTKATVGTGSTTGVPMFAGDFDNVYFTSASGSNPSGNLYACGNTSGNATLYQLRITNDTMASTGTLVFALSSASTTCSPITESDTGGTDRIFVSVQSNGAAGAVNCPTGGGGCVMAFNVPTTINGALPTGTSGTLGTSGGTSGIVIDNNVVPGTVHTSQVYFSTLTGSTAVQASQSGLQ